MSTTHPAQDLINRAIELQHRLEDFKPNIRNNWEVKREYDNATIKVADARTAIMALVAEFDKVFATTNNET